MRSAVVILSMVAAIAAEAPYHLPRPAAHAPQFSYPAAPAPAPAPPPYPLPRAPPSAPQTQPQFIQYPPQPAPQIIQSPGYHYQQPTIAPAYLQPAPQLQHHFYSYPPAPQPIPAAPSHSLISHPQIQYAQPQHQQIQQTQPNLNYGQPQYQGPAAPRPEIPAYPIQPLPAFIAPQPAPPRGPPSPPPPYPPRAPPQQGYSYQQPQPQPIQYTPQPQPIQYTPQLPLQTSNNAGFSALSSYQADSNQYRGEFVHNEPLDSTVVNRVESIIKDNEHASARNAGYVSLISGVSLEGARPSVEVSSFIHNSPLASPNLELTSGTANSSNGSTAASEPAAAPSQDYGFPTITTNSQVTQAESNLSFLPQIKPGTSYGAPQ